MSHTYLFILLVVSIGLNACRNDKSDAVYNELIAPFIKEHQIPGMFIAVVKDDLVLYKGNFGASITDNTCMELGSISKAFTGDIIYSLHAEKRLSIDDTITKYFPNAPATWSRITIKHLLTHTSGIQNYLLDPRFKAADFFQGTANDTAQQFLNAVTTDSMVSMFYSLPLDFAPGTSWAYSNTGYYLLGKIADKVTGKPFFQLAKEKLFLPLGMDSTVENELASRMRCLATGYIFTDSEVKPAPVLTSNYAYSAGAWATTGGDMIKYLKAIHAKKLFADSLGSDWRSIYMSGNYPFTYFGGRFYTEFEGMKIIAHNGGTAGFSSSWIYVPEKNISIIVMMNRRDYAPVDRLAWDVLARFEYSLKYPTERIKGAEKQTQYVKSILSSLKNNTPYPVPMWKELKIFMESENGRGMWQWQFERGIPDSAYCVGRGYIGSMQTYRFVLPFNGFDYRMTLVVDKMDRILQIRWW